MNSTRARNRSAERRRRSPYSAAQAQRPSLNAFKARIDNNPAKNAIRPIALGRKNWFFGNQRSWKAAAKLMRMIYTCKQAGVEPYAYLLDAILRLPSIKTTELVPRLSTKWKQMHEAAARPGP